MTSRMEVVKYLHKILELHIDEIFFCVDAIHHICMVVNRHIRRVVVTYIGMHVMHL